MSYSLGELAAHVDGTLSGNADTQIESVASLEKAGKGQVAFIASKDYLPLLESTRAAAVILTEEMLPSCKVEAIVSPNPHLAFTRIAQLLHPAESFDNGVHETAVVSSKACLHPESCVAANAVIDDDADIQQGVVIGPGCYVGKGVKIATGSRLVANVTVLAAASIGKDCIIHPGVVLGADGFGLSQDGNEWLKVPQLGSVIIGDRVEIGANTTVDRGALNDTILGNGVKIDNQVQVAHNVVIGDNTAIAGCVGIAGSARIGRNCTVGGAAGIIGHLEIADNVHITAMSLVTRSISKAGVYSSGTPLQENREWHRNFVRFRQLDEMAKRIKLLEKKLEQLDKG